MSVSDERNVHLVLFICLGAYLSRNFMPRIIECPKMTKLLSDDVNIIVQLPNMDLACDLEMCAA